MPWTAHLSATYLHSAKRMAFSVPNTEPGDTLDSANLHLTLEKGRWALAVYADNATNEAGAVSPRVLEVASDSVQRYTAYRLRPRTVGIELRYLFGK